MWLPPGVLPPDYILETVGRLEEAASMLVDVRALSTAPIAFNCMVYTRGVPLVVRDRTLHNIDVAATILGYADIQTLRSTASTQAAKPVRLQPR